MSGDYIVQPNPPVDAPPFASLYERLGGEAGLQRLVKWFYARLRYEPEVEAIFREHVRDWPAHLQTIVDFWAQVTGGPQRYAGGMGRHVFLQLSPVHYEVWLAVWGRNCNEVLPPREATEMMALAQDFGNRLQQMSEQHRNAQQQMHPDVTS